MSRGTISVPITLAQAASTSSAPKAAATHRAASGTVISVNTGKAGTVYVNGLLIEGGGTAAATGISCTNAGTLHIPDCLITNDEQ